MAGTLTLVAFQPNPGGRENTRVFAFKPSATAGQGYKTGGDTLNFSTALNPQNAMRAKLPALNPPLQNRFVVGSVPAGYTVEIFPNTVAPTISNYLIKIMVLSTGAELAQADYPAALSGDQIVFTVTTPKKNG